MAADDLPSQPSLPWRTGSALVTGAVGFLCRSFLIGFNRLEVNGWDGFQRLLDERSDVQGRSRGLITGMRYIFRAYIYELYLIALQSRII